MLNKSVIWSVFLYGLLIVLLGYYGFHKSGSHISLYAGVGLGALLLISTLVMVAGKIEGAYIALILTTLLTGVFAYRYTVTALNIPAILAVVSGGMLLFLLARIARWKA